MHLSFCIRILKKERIDYFPGLFFYLSMRNKYLEILNLQPGATKAEIKAAYRKLSKEYHPDISQADDAQERFVAVNEAYKFLLDVGPKPNNQRTSYDYDPEAEEYEKWRRQARAHAKKKAEEVERMQEEMIKMIVKAFNFLVGFMILFNAALITDYFLPRNQASYDIVESRRVQEVLVKADGNIISDLKYDLVIFKHFKMKFDQTKAIEFVRIKQADVITTPIFNNPMAAGITANGSANIYINIGNVYAVFSYLFPLLTLFILIYLFVLRSLDHKLTLALFIVVVFVFQLTVFL